MIDRKFGLGVFVCVFNRDFSKILLLKRNEEKRKRSGADWGNIGGRVELGELLVDACLREAKEEIGVDLNPKRVKLVDIKETPYMSDIFHAIHFVYVTMLDENEKIILNFNCDNESETYEWFDLKNLPDKTLDSKEYLLELKTRAKKEFLDNEK
ncbi:MAG: NUDIX hydrolase [Candidatus Nanoarchaeia archaeon]|nr:NUDIX hydrolase [Candidatus Nanoarchaeia archaeon]